MSSPSNHSKVSREVAGRAVDALLGFLRASAKLRKAQLLEHDDFIYLNISVRRFRSTSRIKPYRIPLPHTLHPLDPTLTELCLIADDSHAEAARSIAARENLPFHKVIPLSELRSDYVPFEARRRLCNSYHIFFAERRIIPVLSHIIGNYFFKKKKIPLSINLSRPGWPEAVREACRSTYLHLGSGTCSGLKVGMVSMNREQIIDNLMAAIEGAVQHVPKKWANIRSMFIRSVQSVALPIYQAVPEMGMKIDASPIDMVNPLDAVVVQETDVKRGVDKKNEKKSGLSKKRKVRIHDVDYDAAIALWDLGEENDGNGEEERVNDEFGLDKKVTKMKKEEQEKLIKGEKGRLTGNMEDECEDKENGAEFIEPGTKRKKPKRAKKIVTTGVEEYVIKDAPVNDYGDGKKLQLKKKMNAMKSKGKKGKKDIVNDKQNQEHFTIDEANMMNFLSSTASYDDNEDHFDDEDSHVKKKVNKNQKGCKVKNVKKVKKTKLRQ